jgi:DNA-binding NarL/FixJ family response regulator
MSANNLTIAVIDDDPAMCEMIGDSLKKKYPDADIPKFNTGEDAIAQLFSAPDIVILDYQLDSVKADALNGIQVLTQLKEQYPDIPVIFLSGQDRTDVAANAIKYGAHDYIVKNETAFHKLELAVNNLITIHHLKRSHQAQKMMSKFVWLLLFLLIGYVIYLRFN